MVPDYFAIRVIIERHFSWEKRYVGLEAALWRVAAYQHTALVYSIMLGVALVTHRFQRPELARSRAHVSSHQNSAVNYRILSFLRSSHVVIF